MSSPVGRLDSVGVVVRRTPNERKIIFILWNTTANRDGRRIALREVVGQKIRPTTAEATNKRWWSSFCSLIAAESPPARRAILRETRPGRNFHFMEHYGQRGRKTNSLARGCWSENKTNNGGKQFFIFGKTAANGGQIVGYPSKRVNSSFNALNTFTEGVLFAVPDALRNIRHNVDQMGLSFKPQHFFALSINISPSAIFINCRKALCELTNLIVASRADHFSLFVYYAVTKDGLN